MLPKERKNLILEYINSNNAVSTSELMTKFNASEATIRRDLTELNNKGLISKVHGGAVSIQGQIVYDFNVSDREEKNIEEKKKIAKYAASLIAPNDLVFLDAGTTTSYIIDYVDAPNVSFVTNAIMHAKKLASRGFKVTLTSGTLKSTTEALVGSDCYEYLSKFHFIIGFFGTNAVNHKSGFTTPDSEEAKIKEHAIQHTLCPYVLCDHEKFGLTAPVSFSKFEDACIITTGNVPESYRKDNTIIFVE